MAYGDYWQKVRHYRYSVSTDTQTGQQVPAYTQTADLWAWVKEIKGKIEQHVGAQNHVLEAEIHINQFPALGEKDKLEDLISGRIYEIKGLLSDYDLFETLAQCFVVPSLEGV